MKSILSVVKTAIVKLLDWDFLIAMSPIIFYGLGFVTYAQKQSLLYWDSNCIAGKDGFYDMIKSVDVFFFMLACSYFIYLALKTRKILAEFVSFKDRYLYVQMAQIAVAIPSMFVVAVIIGIFCVPTNLGG